MKLKTVLIVFVFVVLTVFLEGDKTSAEDIISSGKCGANATWVLSGTTTNMTLTISGSGRMYNYSEDESPSPWSDSLPKITKIIVENGITHIGNDAFCSYESTCKATNVSIGDSVTSIGLGAFANCGKLTSIILPNNLTNIGWSAFDKCNSLTEISIPDSVRVLGENAFHGCKNLKSAKLPSGISKTPSGLFEWCNNLTNVIIPNSITTIGWSTFSGCSRLADVTIPDGVTLIDGYAFAGCALTSINIPISVTSINQYAFENCNKLSTVYYAGSEEQWNEMNVVFMSSNPTIIFAEVVPDPNSDPSSDPNPQVVPREKNANPLKLKGKTVKIKYSKLKKKTQTLAITKVISFANKGQGRKTYKICSAKKGKKSFKKYFKINSKTGRVTIKKKLKKGKYKVMIRVTAAGNDSYKAGTKTVSAIVKVK